MKSSTIALLLAVPTAALLIHIGTTLPIVAGAQPAGVPSAPPGTTPQPPQSLPQPPQSLPPAPHTTPPTDPNATPPAAPAPQPGPAVLIDPTDPRLTPSQREVLIRVRASRPFAFQSAQSEAVFYDGVQRLTRDEQRFAAAADDQLHRLGEIRTMPAERQMPALFDLLQQVLISNREMQQYLVRSRSAWTGDMPPTDLSPASPNLPGSPNADSPAPVAPRTNTNSGVPTGQTPR